MGGRHLGRRRREIVLMVVTALLLALSACGNASPAARSSATATAVQATHTATIALTPTVVLGNKQVSWTVVSNIPAKAVALNFAPSDPRTAYLCADDGPAASSLPATSRLYISADGGQSWQLDAAAPSLTPDPSSLAACAIFVDAADARDVFLQLLAWRPVGAGYAVARALYRSRDGGATWQQLTALDRTDGFRSLDVVGARLIAEPHYSVYGASRCDPTIKPTAYTGVEASDDGGATWHEIGQDIESQGYSPFALSVAGNTLFAVASQVPASACDPTIPARTLWKSMDGGDTWSMVSIPISNVVLASPNFTAKATGTGYYGVMLGYSYVVDNVSSVALLYSSDSGSSWSQLSFPSQISIGPGSSIVVTATPTGAVLIANELVSYTLGDLYALQPSDSSPSWVLYAAASRDGYGNWQIVSTPQGATLWDLAFSYGNGSQLATLPLP